MYAAALRLEISLADNFVVDKLIASSKLHLIVSLVKINAQMRIARYHIGIIVFHVLIYMINMENT